MAAPAQAAAAAAPHCRLPWETVLHLVRQHLDSQADREAVRLVSREWRAAADAAWQRAALEPPAGSTPDLGAGGAPPAAAPHELCLVGLADFEQLMGLLLQLACGRGSPSKQPLALGSLRALALSAEAGLPIPLLCSLREVAANPALRLQRLQLYDVWPGLHSLTGLTSLTELEIALTSPSGTQLATVDRVSSLAALSHLKALSLPQLEEGERDALAALSSLPLTRLAFTAAGKGAVGPSLLPLAPTLRKLAIGLAHTHDRFIVLHPQVKWAALRGLAGLRRLRVHHLAAYTFFPAPEVTWSDEAPLAQEADQLAAALPHIQELELRLSYCRLAEEQVTEEPEELLLPCWADPGCPPASAAQRPFCRTVERVPVRLPGRRRPDSFYAAWWQPAMQARLAAAAEAPGQGPEAAAARAAVAERLHRLLADREEVGGWTAIRPGNHQTHDVLVRYWRPK